MAAATCLGLSPSDKPMKDDSMTFCLWTVEILRCKGIRL